MAQSKRKLYVIRDIFFFICDSSYIYASEYPTKRPEKLFKK